VVRATVVSNVPGTPNLIVIPAPASWQRDSLKTYDVSLENVLSYSEASIEIAFSANYGDPGYGSVQCGGPYGPCGRWFEAQLRDLRVVGARR
jgi:hypothetical protein